VVKKLKSNRIFDSDEEEEESKVSSVGKKRLKKLNDSETTVTKPS